MQVQTEEVLFTDWQDFNASDFGAVISLARKGSLPRLIVVKAAGDLKCTKANGEDGTLTAVPAGFEHRAPTATIAAGQTTPITVYW